MNEFEDKVVIVTGAGRGIGREHALEFARRGANVVVNDLGTSTDGRGRDQLADSVVAEIRAAGGSAVANYGSVADKEDAIAIVDQAVAEYGTVDILINNARILRNRTETITNTGITLAPDASYEDFLAHKDQILDLSEFEVRGADWSFDAINL